MNGPAANPPSARIGIYGFFNPGSRLWTPAWDATYQQPKDVMEVQLPDGKWHRFERMVCQAQANIFRMSKMDLNKVNTP